MTTNDIKNKLELGEEWKRGRKVKDDKDNIIREFYDNNLFCKDGNYYGEILIVKTDTLDNDIIYYDEVSASYGKISGDDLKDSSMPWARYVYCYGVPTDRIESEDGEELVFINPYIYWRDEHCLYDGHIATRFFPEGLGGYCECTFYFEDGKREEVIRELKENEFFEGDPWFAEFFGIHLTDPLQ